MNFFLTRRIAFVLLILFLVQYFHVQSHSRVCANDLNARISIDKQVSEKKQERNQVFVFLVNEPKIKSYNRIQNWLLEKDGPFYSELATGVERDRARLPASISKEIKSIRRNVPVEVGAVVFSNELIRKGAFLRKLTNEKEFASKPFAKSDPTLDFSTTPDPVATPSGFKDIFLNLANEFPGENNEFILVSKSHGSREYMLSTFMGKLLGCKTSDQFFKKLEDTLSEAGLAIDANGEISKTEFNPELAPETDSKKQVEQAPKATTAAKSIDTLGIKMKIFSSGLAKDQYLQIFLEEAKAHNQVFPAVFFESCSSELSPNQLAKLHDKKNLGVIGDVYTSDKTGVRFSTIKYEEFFAEMKRKKLSLSDAFVAYLDQEQQEQTPIKDKLYLVE